MTSPPLGLITAERSLAEEADVDSAVDPEAARQGRIWGARAAAWAEEEEPRRPSSRSPSRAPRSARGGRSWTSAAAQAPSSAGGPTGSPRRRARRLRGAAGHRPPRVPEADLRVGDMGRLLRRRRLRRGDRLQLLLPGARHDRGGARGGPGGAAGRAGRDPGLGAVPSASPSPRCSRPCASFAGRRHRAPAGEARRARGGRRDGGPEPRERPSTWPSRSSIPTSRPSFAGCSRRARSPSWPRRSERRS